MLAGNRTEIAIQWSPSDRQIVVHGKRWPKRLQVISGIGEVEALVDQREIGHDVADGRVTQSGPVQEGGVAYSDAADIALSIGGDQVDDVSAPALDDADGIGILLENDRFPAARCITACGISFSALWIRASEE